MSIAHRASSLSSLLHRAATPVLHHPASPVPMSRVLSDNRTLDSAPWAGLFLHTDDLTAPYDHSDNA